MAELKPGSKVSLSTGGSATVERELGRGGQGIVYLVDLNGEKMALKWYITPPDDNFYRNLENNILKGAPSKTFLWPEYLAVKQNGSYGYLMRLRPSNYYEFGNFLLAKVRFASYTAMMTAALKITNGFMMLHRFGYSYQDLNDGNFFIDPQTGDVLICDNDNVMADGEKSGIMGKARYMAPEVVQGSAPDKYSDRFSLSVILFMLFYANHPFEGERVVACPCLTENYEKKFYGTEAVFVYDPQDASNRPVKGIHNNVMRRWPAFPEALRRLFINEFSAERLGNPRTRLIESQWEKALIDIRDHLVRCPHCGEETFVDESGVCMDCGKSIDISRRLNIGTTRSVILTPGTPVYLGRNTVADALVQTHASDKQLLLLKNLTAETWAAETPSGRIKSVAPGEMMPANPGIKIKLPDGEKGEFATV